MVKINLLTEFEKWLHGSSGISVNLKYYWLQRLDGIIQFKYGGEVFCKRLNTSEQAKHRQTLKERTSTRWRAPASMPNMRTP
jgi:hypothetical protein